MKYVVAIRRSAEREMDRLPDPIHARIVERIFALEQQPRPRGAKKLSGRSEYRLRVGDYRVLYVVDTPGKRIEIVSVGHRGDVYR